ncbi:hypothetical protein F4604DRAFT_695680 [Suillus subluteus]|nr:hypothetical protein F4604DRAFT_695680 [Suillus subluteus]
MMLLLLRPPVMLCCCVLSPSWLFRSLSTVLVSNKLAMGTIARSCASDSINISHQLNLSTGISCTEGGSSLRRSGYWGWSA